MQVHLPIEQHALKGVSSCVLDQLEDSTSAGIRDRALIVVGFAGAVWRSALVALDLRGVWWTQVGSEVLED